MLTINQLANDAGKLAGPLVAANVLNADADYLLARIKTYGREIERCERAERQAPADRSKRRETARIKALQAVFRAARYLKRGDRIYYQTELETNQAVLAYLTS